MAECILRCDNYSRFLESIPEASIDIICADPPYKGANEHLSFGTGRIVGDYKSKTNEKWFAEWDESGDSFVAFLQGCKRVLKHNGHMYLMLDSFSLLSLGHYLGQEFNVKNIIVWDKINMGMGYNMRRCWEAIVFMTSSCKRPVSSRKIRDIWPIKRLHRAKYPAQKPVELFEAMIASSICPGEDALICDPFVGSGSSALASVKRGCRFIGADISEKAIEMTRQRVDTYLETGKDFLQLKSADIDPRFKKVFW